MGVQGLWTLLNASEGLVTKLEVRRTYPNSFTAVAFTCLTHLKGFNRPMRCFRLDILTSVPGNVIGVKQGRVTDGICGATGVRPCDYLVHGAVGGQGASPRDPRKFGGADGRSRFVCMDVSGGMLPTCHAVLSPPCMSFISCAAMCNIDMSSAWLS